VQHWRRRSGSCCIPPCPVQLPDKSTEDIKNGALSNRNGSKFQHRKKHGSSFAVEIRGSWTNINNFRGKHRHKNLTMENHISPWYFQLYPGLKHQYPLVGGIPTPLKNDGVHSSVGMIFHSQLFLESHNPFMFLKPPTRYSCSSWFSMFFLIFLWISHGCPLFSWGFNYGKSRIFHQCLPLSCGAVDGKHKTPSGWTWRLIPLSFLQWIGLRENLNRKPWFLPSNIGVSG